MTFKQLLESYYELNPSILDDPRRDDIETGMRFVYEEMQSPCFIGTVSIGDADEPGNSTHRSEP